MTFTEGQLRLAFRPVMTICLEITSSISRRVVVTMETPRNIKGESGISVPNDGEKTNRTAAESITSDVTENKDKNNENEEKGGYTEFFSWGNDDKGQLRHAINLTSQKNRMQEGLTEYVGSNMLMQRNPLYLL